LYFSCKNYQELAQSRITKVVEYFTTNPTKLVLQFSYFSMIFYEIYKNQENCNTIGDTLLQKTPRKDTFLCNVTPGVAGRRGEAKFRRAATGLGQGRA
jgi:hypothetical protein